MLDPRISQGFPTLDMLIAQPDKAQLSHPSQSLAEVVAALTPRTAALCKYLSKIRRGVQTPSFQVETMLASGIDNRMLETFPSAVVAGIREAIVECQSSPPTTWNETLLEVVGREDLNMLLRPDAEWSPSSASLIVSRIPLITADLADNDSLLLGLRAEMCTVSASPQRLTIRPRAPLKPTDT